MTSLRRSFAVVCACSVVLVACAPRSVLVEPVDAELDDTVRCLASGPEQRAALERQCERGAPAACEALARFFLAGAGVPTSLAEASRWQRKACEAAGGEGDRCYPRWPTPEAIRWDAWRCLTEGAYCAAVGATAHEGWYGEPRAELARSFYEAGCHRDAPPIERYQSCGELALSLLTSGSDREAARGVELSNELCAQEDGRPCVYLALAHELGLGTRRDLEAAIGAYRRHCNLAAVYEAREAGSPAPVVETTSNDLACLRLAVLAADGKVAVSKTTTAHLFAETCLESQSAEVRAIACSRALGTFVASGFDFDPPPKPICSGCIELVSRSRQPRSSFAIVRILAYESCAEGVAEGCRVLAETYEALDRLGFEIGDGSGFVCPAHASLAP